MNAMIWLILFVVLVVFEIATMGLTTIWFAAGALIAFFASLLHATWWLQFVFFIVVSLIMLIFTRPFALRYVNRHTTKTNIDSVIGQTGRVIAQIDNAQASGYVTINGIEWAARSADGSVIAVIVLVILASCIKIVPQAQAVVLERLGAYKETWNVGIHFKVPFIDKMARRVVLKEQVADFPPQPVITKDNVTMRIDTVIFFQITDPKLFAYGVENPIMAIENLTATTLRNIIGELAFDQTLTSREVINSKMRVSLDVATDPWGIKVNRVEVKNIIPPAAIQDAMEKQKRAELEKIEAVTRSEGQKQSAVLVAEGKKRSLILDAEAEKESAILRAEAQKQKMIREAEGQAEAIRVVQMANAEGLKMIKEAGADEAVLRLKSLEAFEKAADGQATKIIIPSEIQGLAGLAKSVVEVAKEA